MIIDLNENYGQKIREEYDFFSDKLNKRNIKNCSKVLYFGARGLISQLSNIVMNINFSMIPCIITSNETSLKKYENLLQLKKILKELIEVINIAKRKTYSIENKDNFSDKIRDFYATIYIVNEISCYIYENNFNMINTDIDYTVQLITEKELLEKIKEYYEVQNDKKLKHKISN